MTVSEGSAPTPRVLPWASAFPPSWEPGLAVASVLRSAGFESWLVGGCVRDLLLGRPGADVDVTTDATPEQVQALFPRTIAVGASFGVVVVLAEPTGTGVEVATFRTDGEYLDGRRPSGIRHATRVEDVRRRDFTINALLLDPVARQIEDLVGGLTDLDRRILRVVGDPVQRLAEDRLRTLRGIRFAAHLDLSWDPPTWQAIQATPLAGLARERIWQEWDKALAPRDGSGSRSRWWRTLVASGHLPEVTSQLPEDPALGTILDQVRDDDDPLLSIALLLAKAGWTSSAPWRDEPLPRERLRRLDVVLAALARLQDPTLSVATRRRCFRPEAALLARLGTCLGIDRPWDDWLAAEAAPWSCPVRAGDLLALGAAPGPALGTWLRAIEDASLEDPALDRAGLLARVPAPPASIPRP